MSLARRSLGTLDWPALCEALAERAKSALGGALCREPQLAPDVEGTRRLLAQTGEMVALFEAGAEPPIGRFLDPREALQLASKGAALDGSAIREIGLLLDISHRALRYFRHRAEQAPQLWGLANTLHSDRPLSGEILRAIGPDGSVTDEASPAIRDLRRESEKLRNNVRDRAEKLLEKAKYKNLLQDSYFTVRADRYVLPLRSTGESFKHGIVHDQSRSGETVFVEPEELTELNNRLRVVELELAREIQRVKQELSERLAALREPIVATVDALAALDAVAARARLAVELRATAPAVDAEGGVVALKQLRHPLLALRLGREEVIPNDVRLGGPGGTRGLVISGPNAGGKTITLKGTGLAALMVRAGMWPVCEEGSRIGFFEPVLADIGDAQSVASDLSTFSGHLSNLAAVHELVRGAQRRRATPLLLLDEIMVGTDPAQGVALGRALLEALVDGGAVLIATTHYDELKGLADEDARFENASVLFDPERLRPTYRLQIGRPGRSYAFDIARRLGLDEGVLARASEVLDPARDKLEATLRALEEREAQIVAEQTALAEAKEAAQKAQRDLEQAKRRAQMEEASARARLKEKLDAELEKANAEISKVVRRAVEAGGPREITSARRQMRTLSQRVAESQEDGTEANAPRSEPLELSAIQAGGRVHVQSFGRDGEVLEAPDRKGRVVVQVGRARVTVDAEQLYPPTERRRGGGKQRSQRGRKPPRPEDLAPAAVRASHNTCDLRGQRADEALDAVGRFLDERSVEPDGPVYIIHGHGTGALRRAVRSYLDDSPYVSMHEPGGEREGGDGVTVVHLR